MIKKSIETIQVFIFALNNSVADTLIISFTSAGDNVVVLFGASFVPPDVDAFPVFVRAFVVLPVDATSSIHDTASSSPWDKRDPPYI